MSSTNQSELIVLDANEEFKGKINSLSLFNKSGTLLESVIDTNSIVIEHNASLQSAMEIAADFVGEIIPIINFDTKKAVAVITEGAIFQAYLSKQNQTVDVEKR